MESSQISVHSSCPTVGTETLKTLKSGQILLAPLLSMSCAQEVLETLQLFLLLLKLSHLKKQVSTPGKYSVTDRKYNIPETNSTSHRS